MGYQAIDNPHTAPLRIKGRLKMCGSLLVAALLATAVPLGTAAPAPGAKLSAQDIKQLISGNTAEGRRFKKGRGVYAATASPITSRTYFSADGKVVEKSDSERGVVPAHGEWSAQKNKICITFSDSYDAPGKKTCWKLVARGDGTYELYRKGELKREWDRIVSGNPHGLK